MVCNEGSFGHILDVLFRAYAVARDDRTITRNEMATILAKHVIYEDSEVTRYWVMHRTTKTSAELTNRTAF